MPTDTDLARAAQAGDATALGILLERHRAALYAHALQYLGYGDEAHDAVQDAFVTALRRIHTLREPDQVKGWLHTVLRNACLDRLRARRHHDPETPELAAPAADEPESVIDDLALRDWVWTSVGRLSEPLRLAIMLRHFSSCNAYEDIARVCGVPVGTVRSRLAEARRLLADDILRTAASAHDAAATRRRSERARWSEAYTDAEILAAHAADDIEIRKPAGDFVVRGREMWRRCVYSDFEAGVGFALDDVAVGGNITILEARFINPSHDPDHCPPATTQVLFQGDGQVERILLYYAPRPT